jgi:hypothetical protein
MHENPENGGQRAESGGIADPKSVRVYPSEPGAATECSCKNLSLKTTVPRKNRR